MVPLILQGHSTLLSVWLVSQSHLWKLATMSVFRFQALSFQGNVSHSWNFGSNTLIFIWLQQKKDTKGDKIKTSTFLTCIGQNGRKIYENFNFEPGDETKLALVLRKFSEYYNPRKYFKDWCLMNSQPDFLFWTNLNLMNCGHTIKSMYINQTILNQTTL